MENDRLRVSIDQPYVDALGRALFCFAALEWNVVWCCERLRSGYINGLKRKTAGVIAKDFSALSTSTTNAELNAEMQRLGAEFGALVDIRNSIMHGKPGTAPNKDQRLFRDGSAITIDDVNKAADQFTACSIELNSLLYGALQAP